MADWQDIAKNNLNDAELLLENKKYRSATSRLYYAAFAALTFELIRRGASEAFSNNKATPSHTTKGFPRCRRHFQLFGGETMNDNDLLNLIENEINLRHKNDGNNFHVQRNGVRHEGNWRFVTVLHEPADMRAYKYTEFWTK